MSQFLSVLYVLLAIASLGYAKLANVKTVDSSSLGKEFIIGAVSSVNIDNSNMTLMITSEGLNNATISSSITGDILVPSFSDSVTVVLPGSLIPNPKQQQTTMNLGIRVRTQNVASVQAIVNTTNQDGSEGTIVFPVEALGKVYVINGVDPNASFTIVAPTDSIDVTVYYNYDMPKQFFLKKALDSVSFFGNNLNGLIVNAPSPVAVFLGQGCSDSLNTASCNYLWEQAPRVEKFGTQFVLVNPNAGSEANSGNSTTVIRLLNGSTRQIAVSISGLTDPYPIRLESAQSVAISTTNLTNMISSTGALDVQIITDSLEFGNRTQWGLIPNDQFVDKAFFSVPECTNRQISLVALTSDVKDSKNSLKFNDVPFDLSLFQVSADPNYSYVITKTRSGANILKASFKFAGYLFANQEGVTNFGSVIGRGL